MATADVPSSVVWRERAVLGMFGGDLAIFELLTGSPHREIARRGYVDGWKEFAKSGRLNAEVVEIYSSRAPKYGEAATSDQPITLPLTEFLVASVGIGHEHTREPMSTEIASRIGHISVLATFMSLIFDASYQTAANELADKGIIRRPQGK